MIGDNWRETAEYAEAMDYLQRGKWSEALAALAALHAAYPHESAIESLIAETQLRIEAGKHQISRRRLPRVSRGALLLTLLVFVLFLLGWFAVNLYRDVITPSLARRHGPRTNRLPWSRRLSRRLPQATMPGR